MTRPVNPNTLCGAVALAVAQLGKDAVEAVTDRSISLARAWADPDNDANHIPGFQILALDLACKEAGFGTPIADAMRHLLDRAPAKQQAPVPLESRVVTATADLGRLADSVSAAARDGCLSAAEKQRIRKAACQTIGQLNAVVDAVAPATPQPSSARKRR